MKKPELPNVRERLNPSGKSTYYLDYWDPFEGKRKRESVGTRKVDAQKRAHQVYQTMIARYLGEPTDVSSQISLVDLVDTFFRGREGRIAPASIGRYRILTRHLLNFFKEKLPKVILIHQITRAHLDGLLESLKASGQQPKTLNAQIQLIKALFNFAVEEGYLSVNPAQRIKPFRETKVSEHAPFWTKTQVENILAESHPPYRDAFEFLYHTGLRKAELMNLTWDDVNTDPQKPTITVQAKEAWTPKTNRRRIVPLNKTALAIINRQTRSERHKYIFKGLEGGQVHRDRIYRELKRALEVLELEGDVHQFRHTFASHMVMAGVGLETVSKLLGHTTIDMTMKYAHLAESHLQLAVDKLAE